MRRIQMERFITKEEEGRYLFLPFQVPERVERVKICYFYDDEENIVDFGVARSREDLVGWGGSTRKEVLISIEGSSDGFRNVPITPGQWNILLGAYRISANGVRVSFEVIFYEKEYALWKGDIHVHSCASDGNFCYDQLLKLAHQEQLDYFFMTDHNNYREMKSESQKEKVKIFSGVEWTTYKGHAGMLGKVRPFDNFVSNSMQETKKIFLKAKQRESLIILNHPFCPFCGWKWGTDGLLWDLLEIWNGALTLEYNLKCVKWWEDRLLDGWEIPIVGGSDFHKVEKNRKIGHPCTCVFASSCEEGEVIKALKKGNSFLTISAQGPMLAVPKLHMFPGSRIEVNSELEWKFYQLEKKDVICIIQNGKEERIFCNTSEMIVKRSMKEEGYCRVEIRRIIQGQELPIFFTNPYYIKKSGKY